MSLEYSRLRTITHTYFTERVLKSVTGTYLADLIQNNKQWFLCGMMYPDVTVIYYYTQWTSYSATHSWEFQRRLWQDADIKNSDPARAFAIGVGVHLLQDSITHNKWIPYKIRVSLVQNNIIHPLSEGLLETKLISEDPLAESISSTSFSYWNKPFPNPPSPNENAFYDPDKMRNLTPVEWADKILGNPGFIDEAQIFNTILSGGEFYTKGYVIPQTGGWWGMFRAISDFLSKIVSVSDADSYIEETIQITTNWLRTGKGDNPSAFVPATDPTGYESLKSADSYVVSWTVTIVVILVCVIVYYKYIWKKKE